MQPQHHGAVCFGIAIERSEYQCLVAGAQRISALKLGAVIVVAALDERFVFIEDQFKTDGSGCGEYFSKFLPNADAVFLQNCLQFILLFKIIYHVFDACGSILEVEEAIGCFPANNHPVAGE
jgi:hypothetical protein